MTLSPETAAKFALRAGTRLSESRIREILDADARHDALSSSIRLLSRRPRSEREIRDYLRKRGIPSSITQETVFRLKELGLLDDNAFALSWVDSHDRTSPRSRRMLAAELRARGVERTTAAGAVSAVNDEDAACRAASRRARNLTGLDFPVFRRRIVEFLLRRGFNLETAEGAARRVWLQMTGVGTDQEHDTG
jgi:regulatory protein